MLIDVSRLVGRLLKKRIPTGIDRVGLAYVRHYGARARAVLTISGVTLVCAEDESQALFTWLLDSGRSGPPWRAFTRSLVTGAGKGSTKHEVFLNTGHTGLNSPRYIGMLKNRGVNPIFLIHDLIPITHPEYCRAGEQQRHQTRLRHALSIGSGIICNSQATLDALSYHCRGIGIPMPPAVAAPLASDPLPGTRGIRPIREPYFVLLSTIEPRKNHMMILQAWQRIVERRGAKAPRLVLVGQTGWECEHVTRFLDRSDFLKPYVRHEPRCTDDQLMSWLGHAQALLFPSLVEGYGMPVVEALAHGVPVIASNLKVFREFAGEIPAYADPLDTLRWIDLIDSYCDDADTDRRRQLHRMDTFNAPSWSDHFSRVDELIGRIAPREPAYG